MDGFLVDCYLLARRAVSACSLGLAAGTLQATRPRSLASRAITVVTALALSLAGLLARAVHAAAVRPRCRLRRRDPVPLDGQRLSRPVRGPGRLPARALAAGLIVGSPLAGRVHAHVRLAAARHAARGLRAHRARQGRERRARVVWRHALPPPRRPVVALVGVNMNLILTNLALIETVFNIPGGFRYIERALVNRDVDLVQALVSRRRCSSCSRTSSPTRSTPGWTRACARASRSEATGS